MASGDGTGGSGVQLWRHRLPWPRLARHWRLIGDGQSVHWNGLDEDISVENLLAGRASGESQTSLKRWLEERAGR